MKSCYRTVEMVRCVESLGTKASLSYITAAPRPFRGLHPAWAWVYPWATVLSVYLLQHGLICGPHSLQG